MIIDLGSELLLDRSEISDPYLRLLAAALGQAVAEGSPWVALDKQLAAICGLSPAAAHQVVPAMARPRRLPRLRRTV